MKKSPKLFMLIALFVFAISCSSDDSDSNDSETLQGEVFGSDFTAKGGQAFTSGDDLSINITNISADCSSNIFDYDLYVSAYITPEVGTYSDVTVIFHTEDELPLNSLGSTVKVTELTDDEITVEITASSVLSDSNVQGTFTIPICD